MDQSQSFPPDSLRFRLNPNDDPGQHQPSVWRASKTRIRITRKYGFTGWDSDDFSDPTRKYASGVIIRIFTSAVKIWRESGKLRVMEVLWFNPETGQTQGMNKNVERNYFTLVITKFHRTIYSSIFFYRRTVVRNLLKI